MTSIRLRLASLLALALATPVTALGCMADIDSAESEEADDFDDSDDSEEVASAGQALSVSDLAYQVEGSSTVTFAGTSVVGIVGASEGIVTSGNEVQGVQASVSLGVGISPIDVGVQSCNATVTRIW